MLWEELIQFCISISLIREMIIEGIIFTIIAAVLIILYPSYKLKRKRNKLVITSPISIFSSKIDQTLPKKKKQKKSKKKLKKIQSTNSTASPQADEKEALKNDQQSEKQESEDQQKAQIRKGADIIIEQQIDVQKQQEQQNQIYEKTEQLKSGKSYTVLQEIDMIRHYFIQDLQELLPYNGRYGHYRLTLQGPNKVLPIEWKYSYNYPQEPLELTINRDNLKPFEVQILDKIIEENLRKFENQPYYMLIFELATRLYQELLIHLNEQISQVQASSEQQGKVSSLPSQSKDFNLKVAHMKPEQLRTKKQIYGKILDEIFYLHDLVEKPDNSAMKIIQNQEPLQIKQHNTRGRYQAQFQQLELIGEGGFGKVYRVRHKLDGNIYAIKKAVVNYEDLTDRKMLKEVALLSKLNHPNIVRYYQSWLEDAHSIAQIKEDMSFSDNEKSKIDQLQNIYAKWKNDRSGIRFAHSKNNNSYSGSQIQNSDIVFDYGQDSGIVFGDQELGSQSEGGIQMGDGSSIGEEGDYCEASDASLVQGLKVFPFKILYIAMQCCSGINLREFINRHFGQEEHKVQILRGILEGLSYIHGKKIIHRDLKPANIFLTDQNKVKIGDFGLATCEQRSVSISLEQDESDFLGDKTKAVGTGFYRAPEQLKSQKYDQKVDIYSLGIIILELFHQFNTAMQRTQTLKQITLTHQLPKQWSGDYSSDIGESVQLCLQEIPERRPSAGKLLQRFRNKYFTELVSCIANPKHFQFSELLSHLFAIKNEHGSVLMRRDAFKPYLSHVLTEIYRVHGAVHFPTLPLISAQDHMTLNGLKIKNDRSNKFLLLTNRGIVLEYTSNCLKAWLIYVRDAMRKRKGFALMQHKTPIRRYTFEKVVNWQHKNEADDPALCFHQKMVSAFDLTYRLEDGFNSFYLCEALRISQAIVSTLHLTQRKPPILISHSQLHKLIAKKFNVPLEIFYKALLSIDETKFSMMSLQKKIAFLQSLNLPVALCKKISNVYEMTFQKASDLIESLQIEGNDRILQEIHELDNQKCKVVRNPVRWRLGIPYNSCHGFFWEVGIVKGLTSIQQYAPGQQLCNYHVEILMDSQIQQPDVSLWCIGQYLEEQMQRMICQCWKNGLSTKWYEWQVGQKEDHCRHNIILRRKNDRVQVMLRHNQVRKGEIGEHREERQSSFISIQQFNVEVIKQMLVPHHYYY